MRNENYRIISIDGSKILKCQEQDGGFKIDIDKEKDKFTTSFDFSLDLIFLEEQVLKGKSNDMPKEDTYGNLYSLVLVNVSFERRYKDKGIKDIREELYKNGFILNGIPYKRYKRSCGSSREGNCLFIMEKYLEKMSKWSDTGLSPKLTKSSIASWEAYRALSLSSIDDIVIIPFNSILFIDDKEDEFKTTSIVIEENKEKKVVEANEREILIKNKIWDGEALLDESLFTGSYKKRSMLLLRNKFFKSCGFRTDLQKFFKDHNITKISDLSEDVITFAENISDIKMVVTPSSLKFLKFMDGGLNKDNLLEWYENINNIYGVVKYDKKTPHFNGRLVQTSYQFINTLNLSREDVDKLLERSKNYIENVWKDDDNYARLIYHLDKAYKKDSNYILNIDDEDIDISLATREELILKALRMNIDFVKTEYFRRFKYDNIKSAKEKIKKGKILVSGTYATLFGNGAELLLSLTKDGYKEKIMKDNTIYSKKFKDKELIAGARSPHITMGNILLRTNDLENDFINTYFPNLSEEIVCVNAIGENIQQMLNGCDYDSDTILLTNDSVIVDAARKEENKFLVPVSNIDELNDDDIDELNDDDSEKLTRRLVNLDHTSSNNSIGEIVNKSQKLNSHLWDEANKNHKIDDIYKDICKLAVFSGIEIDSAKKTYVNDANDIMPKLDNDYNLKYPKFFKDIYDKTCEKYKAVFDGEIDNNLSYKEKMDYINDKKKENVKNAKDEFNNLSKFYETAMEYVYEYPKKISLKKNKLKDLENIKYIDLFYLEKTNAGGSYYEKAKAIMSIFEMNSLLYSTKIKAISMNKDNKGLVSLLIQDKRQIFEATTNEIKSLLIPNQKNGLIKKTLYLVLKLLDNSNDNKAVFFGMDILLNIDEVCQLLKNNGVKNYLKESSKGDIELYYFKYQNIAK